MSGPWGGALDAATPSRWPWRPGAPPRFFLSRSPGLAGCCGLSGVRAKLALRSWFLSGAIRLASFTPGCLKSLSPVQSRFAGAS